MGNSGIYLRLANSILSLSFIVNYTIDYSGHFRNFKKKLRYGVNIFFINSGVSSNIIWSNFMSKIAIVTGGTRGIGAAIARGLKDAGYKVAANFQGNQEAADVFQKETGIPVFKWNVADYESCKDGVRRVEDSLGGTVDILVNNAGVTRDSMFHKMTFEQWNTVISTNLNSLFNMTSLVINAMREKKFGRIVNISSINGVKGQIGQTNYSASKAGVIGFTKALAQEVAAKGITVNAVAPGYTETDMVKAVPEDVLASIIKLIPVGRLGQVEDISNAVLFLVSDKAGFVTGETINVNGGQYLR